MMNISKNIQKGVSELLLAKEISLKLASMLNIYNKKIRAKSSSELKLSEQITIKKLLVQKLLKEIQGFREAPSTYSELEKVKPENIKFIIEQIKNVLEK